MTDTTKSLATVYAKLREFYTNGNEIPIVVYKEYTVTLKDSWSNRYRIYNGNGECVGNPTGLWWEACCELIAHIHGLKEFPYESRWEVNPTNPIYDEAVDLYLQYSDLTESITDGLRNAQ